MFNGLITSMLEKIIQIQQQQKLKSINQELEKHLVGEKRRQNIQ